MAEPKTPAKEKAPAAPAAAPEGVYPELREFQDLPLRVAIDLGSRPIRIAELLDLKPGTIVALDKLTGEPVDVILGGETIALAEIVVSEETLVARISQVLKEGETRP